MTLCKAFCTFSKSPLCSSQHSWPSILMCCTSAVAASVSLFGALRPEIKGSPWVLWVPGPSQSLVPGGTQQVKEMLFLVSELLSTCFPIFSYQRKVEVTEEERELTFWCPSLVDETLYLLDALFPLTPCWGEGTCDR